MEAMGAGEILINSIDKDGTMSGYDVDMVKEIASGVGVPVIACGGAASVEHLREVVENGHVSAVSAGSMFVFQGVHRAVLISFPDAEVLKDAFDVR